MTDTAREKLSRLSKSYLAHIRIAVQAGDSGAPFRTFIDNWAAYSAEDGHHRSKGDRPKWFNNPCAISRRSMLLSLEFRSQGAEAILRESLAHPEHYRSGRQAKKRELKLMVDHAVPIAVMVARLFDPGADLSDHGIRAILRKYYLLGLLSGAEDAHLNSMGLRSRMPSGWDGENLMARYQMAGITPAAPVCDS